ncbi:MAG: InlB B-repeat-containing protein [Lachnospiraceae bacterium]
MKRMKQLLALFLAIVLTAVAVPVSAAGTDGTDNETVITVESKSITQGETIDVDVSIKNNPGILGVTLEFTYDDRLTLVGASNGPAFSYLTMTKPGKMESPCKFTWDGQEITDGNLEDGTILTLTFELAEDAEAGENYAVSVRAVGSIYDNDLNPVSVSTVNGSVRFVDFTPGDVNGDSKVNISDVILTRRYIVGGYDLSIIDLAADVNDDGKIDSRDVILLRRYIQGGYGVVLEISTRKCIHEMTSFSRVEATCTEPGNIAYWKCSKCEKYFSDEDGLHEIAESDIVIPAAGHHEVTIPAEEPTLTSNPGKTEGVYCDICGTVLVAQEDWYLNTYTIQYDVSNGDEYLASIEVENSNYTTVMEGDGFYLKDLSVEGYKFLGWYDGAGDNARQVTQIQNADHNIQLYAHWEAIEYSVQFKYDTKLAGLVNTDSLNNVKYTVNKTKNLPVLSLDGYTFVGWSDENGVLCTQINKGSTGEKIFYANWISNRNQAWAKKKIGDPYIYNDEDDNIILFTYEIGEIRDVPVYEIDNFGGIISGGVPQTVTKEYSVTTSSSLMDSYSKAAKSATTGSASWTLSDGWTDSVSVSEEWCKENNVTVSEAETMSRSDTGTWYVNNSSGGSRTETTIDNTDTYDLSTTTNNKKTYGSQDETSYDSESKTAGFEVNGSLTVSKKVSGGLDAEVVKASVEKNKSLTVGGSYENKTTSKTGTDTVTKSGSDTDEGDGTQTGTVKNHTTNTSDVSTWNMESGYSNSQTTSSSQSISKTLSEMISQKTGYGSSYINTHDSSSTQGLSSTESSEDEYSSSVTYSTATSEKETVTYTTSNTMTGYHRWVMAGTAHVFAVVGYDIASRSYFTYTYSIMDDELHKFEDYSYSTASFDDNQSTVIDFEIPADMIEYVESKVYATEGLEFDKNGNVTAYSGSDSYVVVPDYACIDNMDGENTVVKITGFSENAFKGKDITGIELSNFIELIPENAFAGCSELWKVSAASVTDIGANAFSGCDKLRSFTLSSAITSLGNHAFDATDFLETDASNAGVVEAAINSGANQIVIGLKNMSDSLDEKALTVPDGTESFTLRGFDKGYKNLTVISDANETKINRLTMESEGIIPLQINSSAVSLYQVNVKNTGISLVLPAKNTELGLYGQVNVTTTGTNALLCKNAVLSQIASGLATMLNVTGNLVTCGTVEENSLLNVVNGEVVTVDSEKWDNLLHSYTLYFDAAGGTCETESMKVANAEKIGELPVPVRTGFSFDGWYTSDGMKVTEDTVFSDGLDVTVYAHWIAEGYTASWSEGTGTTITVTRTSSPYMDAETGALSNGDVVYFGDVLDVTYEANTGFTLTGEGVESIIVTGDVTADDIYAEADPNSHTASWSAGTGVVITVSRTASPYKNAETGTLSNGAEVFFGDVLSINYSASDGYTLSDKGTEEITVTGDVTADDIYAKAKPNRYTYKIIYKSSHGVDLGSDTVTYEFGTTNTISAPAKAGYTTPASQSVAWDSTSEKTITFTYTPTSVSTPQQMASGDWDVWSSGKYGVRYTAYVEYQNRTANSVQVRIKWVNTITANTYFGYGQYFTGNIGGTSTGEVTICTNSTWASSSTSSRSATAYSNWITVNASATQRSVNVSATWRCANGGSGSWSGTMTIPTY